MIDQIKDKLGRPIDSKIKFAVFQFITAGFTTTASCAGHFNHGLPFPWIDFDAKDFIQMKIMLANYGGFKYGLLTEQIGIFGDFRLVSNSKYGGLPYKRKMMNRFANYVSINSLVRTNRYNKFPDHQQGV